MYGRRPRSDVTGVLNVLLDLAGAAGHPATRYHLATARFLATVPQFVGVPMRRGKHAVGRALRDWRWRCVPDFLGSN